MVGGGENFGLDSLIPVWPNRFAQLSCREIDPGGVPGNGQGRVAGTRGGVSVPVADEFRARLIGLALLDRRDAGSGLLIPRCSSVHTVGMRFALDLHFLDAAGAVLAVRRAVPPRRFARCRGAVAVLEVPSAAGARHPT